MPLTVPIVLIGAGPLGLELAVALKRAGLGYMHLEAGQIGSTMQWWPPGTRWFSSAERIAIAGVPLNTPGQEKATREEYLAYLRGIVEQFKLNVRTFTRVTDIAAGPAGGGGFVLRTCHALVPGTMDGPEETILAERVILATGGTASPILLNIPGEGLPHVSHYFQDPHTYFQKNLLIVGGKNSAVEAALRCHRAGAKVHFSYRGAKVDADRIKYWLYPEFSSLLKSGEIVSHFNTCPTEITPTHVTLSPANENSEVAPLRLPVDFVLLMTGYLADMALARQAGVSLVGEDEIPAFNPETMESNVPNLYVAGTAVAGTQRRYKVFLENCHVHVPRIVAHLTGKAPPVADAPSFDRPES